MNVSQKESAAAQRLAEALVAFIVAVEEGVETRRAGRPREKIEVALIPPPPPERVEAPPPRPAADRPQHERRRMLSVPDAAEYLGVAPRSVWRLAAPGGPIPIVRIGRSVRLSVESLDAYIEQVTERAEPRRGRR